MILIAIIFPAFSFLIRGKLLTALLCLLLQVTLIGWIPAAIWAVVSYTNAKQMKQLKEMELRILAKQN
jgi:uncharacterized membrane protein YqaE (UPF0057 family)